MSTHRDCLYASRINITTAVSILLPQSSLHRPEVRSEQAYLLESEEDEQLMPPEACIANDNHYTHSCSNHPATNQQLQTIPTDVTHARHEAGWCLSRSHNCQKESKLPSLHCTRGINCECSEPMNATDTLKCNNRAHTRSTPSQACVQHNEAIFQSPQPLQM